MEINSYLFLSLPEQSVLSFPPKGKTFTRFSLFKWGKTMYDKYLRSSSGSVFQPFTGRDIAVEKQR